MIEIIPNWHPILVHFTIALFATSTGLFFVGSIFSKKSWGETLLKVAHVNLWIGAAITVLTLIVGWEAYNTVAHDGPSHAAMTDHKNWAFATAALFGVVTIWSFISNCKTLKVSKLFLLTVAVAAILLAVTGYKGGEAVYRYGLGVMSLPQISEDGGHGNHSHGEDDDHGNASSESNEYQDSYYGEEEEHKDGGHTH